MLLKHVTNDKEKFKEAYLLANNLQQENIKKGDIYRHFKGKMYQILDVVYDSETNNEDENKKIVVYQALYGEKLKWDRTYTFESDDGLSISLDLLGYTESLTFACACNDLSEFLKNKCKESGKKDIILCGAYDNNTGEGKEIILDN